HRPVDAQQGLPVEALELLHGLRSHPGPFYFSRRYPTCNRLGDLMRPRPSALVVLALAGAVPAAAAARTYVIDASASAVQVHVGKSGVFGFAGHTHDVAA